MSLILEALRKSEAERRRGESPDLRTELPPVPAGRGIRAPRWSRVWTLAALGLLAVAFAWLGWLRPWSTTVPHDTTAMSAPADVPPASADSGPTRRATVIRPGTGARTAAPAPAIGAMPPASGAAVPAPAPARSPTPTPTRQPSAPLAAGPPAAAVATPSSTPADRDPLPAGAGAGAAVPAAPPPTSGAALTLAELTPAQRGALPPLKVSMHMWSAEPARRFVILDGRRMAEGDRAGAVVVDTIGRDDVLLDWDGTPIRLSLR